jgi:cytoskeletal protein CcmA (bactofilin family)
MFGSKKREQAAIATLLGIGTTVSGNIAFRGRVHLEGTIEGDVTGEAGDSVLAIGNEGAVEGTVQVDTLVLNGTVRGDVVARETVELGPTARVDGNLMYHVHGRLVHQSGEQQALPAPEQDDSGDLG